MKRICTYLAAVSAVLWGGMPCMAAEDTERLSMFSLTEILSQMGNVVFLGLSIMATSLLLRFLWGQRQKHRE